MKVDWEAVGASILIGAALGLMALSTVWSIRYDDAHQRACEQKGAIAVTARDHNWHCVQEVK